MFQLLTVAMYYNRLGEFCDISYRTLLSGKRIDILSLETIQQMGVHVIMTDSMAVSSVAAHRAVAFAKAWSPHAADPRCVVTFK